MSPRAKPLDESVQYVFGNEYHLLPQSMAEVDQTTGLHKVHDWTLYVDVIKGDADLIECVQFDLGPSFSPQSVFVCGCPVPMTRPNGAKIWRFETRQQTSESITAHIKIRSICGNVKRLKHNIVVENHRGYESNTRALSVGTWSPHPLKPIRLADAQCYGIELELTSPARNSPESIASHVSVRAGTAMQVLSDHEDRSDTSPEWKIVPDSSIACSESVPDGYKFELRSPVLQGGIGLSQVSNVLKALEEIRPPIQVNESMGFHVQVDVSALQLPQLINVCQNFIKYEDVLDRGQPPSRRTGSEASDKYFRSNCQSLDSFAGLTDIQQRSDALATCLRTVDLVKAMNCDGRYYKLNLQNLVSGRQPTIEFRQHAATMNYEKVSSWVRFCVAFVTNSAKLKSPAPFAGHHTLEYQFQDLFQYVIKDRALHKLFSKWW